MDRTRNRTFARLFCALTIFWMFPAELLAVPARTAPEDLRQPDGTTITVRQFGDEWSNGLRTPDGYTIMKDERSGYWMFAEDAPGGGVRRSNRIVGRHAPTGIRKFLRESPSRAPASTAQAAPAAAPSAAANLGGQPLLVIFVDFTPSVRAGSTAASLYNKFFGPSGSVKHYYETVSYGSFSITPAPENNVDLGGLVNDGIVSVTLNYAHPNTGSAIDNRNRNITRDALIAANQYVDFSQFDLNGDGVLSPTELHIIIVVAGYERSYTSSPCGASVWGHRWGLTGTVAAPTLDGKVVGRTYAQFGEWHCSTGNPPGHEATIGIMAHELGHDLGLPDLYDTDGSSRGIGAWSIMAGGSWNGTVFAGDSPAHFDPWSKFFEGWISPVVVNGTLANQTIAASASTPQFYQLLPGTPSSGEYFLIENRQRINYDATVPGTGLLIWHIDSSKSSNDAECYPGGPSCATSHYLTAVVPADNLFNLERNLNSGDAGDPWPGSSGNANFTATSLPNSNLYSGASSGVGITAISVSGAVVTATFNGPNNGPPDTIINGSPQALTNATNADFTFTSTKANSTFACKLDGAAFAACSSPKSYTGLAAGSHTFQVQATDQSNNTDPTPASFTWTIDNVAPDTSITNGPAQPITQNSGTFDWTGSDNVTSAGNLVYAYRLDPIEAAFSAFGATTEKFYGNLANGNYTFFVKAKDQAGNEDPTPATRSFSVNAAAAGPIVLTYNGMLRDRVGQNNQFQGADNHVDPTFAVTFPTGGATRTVTSLRLDSSDGGIWDTNGGSFYWTLGAASGLDAALYNGANDAVNFVVAPGGSFNVFASDWHLDATSFPSGLFHAGAGITLTLGFSDGTSATAQTTIASAPSLPTVTLTVAAATAAEGGVAGGFSVSRSGSTTAALNVSYSIAGTASNGVDYASLSGSVTIPAGASSATIAVVPVDDSDVEGNETVIISLLANAAYTLGNSSSGTVTILDNDVADTTAPDTSITAGPSGTIFTNSATFSWTGSDNATAAANLVYAYRLDPIEPNFSAFGAATSSTYTNLANGSYTFIVKARDQAGNEDATPATRTFTVSVASGSIGLTYNGLQRDRVGQNNQFQGADSHLDPTFTVTFPTGGATRTITSLRLDSSDGGIWDTNGGSFYWTLGAASGLDAGLYNAANDAVSFAVAPGGSFNIFASDWFLDATSFPGGLFHSGASFTLTIGFSDGTSATAQTTIGAAPVSGLVAQVNPQ